MLGSMLYLLPTMQQQPKQHNTKANLSTPQGIQLFLELLLLLPHSLPLGLSFFLLLFVFLLHCGKGGVSLGERGGTEEFLFMTH